MEKRSHIGLEPDATGRVNPLIWAEEIKLTNPTTITKNDRFDLYFVAEKTWLLPFDENSQLLAKIGANNIHAFDQPILETPQNPAMVVWLDNIKLEHAIEVLNAMGINRIDTIFNDKDCMVMLSGDPVLTSEISFYQEGKLIAKFSME